jgi:hypothetical protein
MLHGLYLPSFLRRTFLRNERALVGLRCAQGLIRTDEGRLSRLSRAPEGDTTNPRSDNLLDVIAALYASEINCSVSTFWDTGWTVRLGDDMNRFAAEATFRPEELDGAAAWLAERACALYPDSQFARRRRE